MTHSTLRRAALAAAIAIIVALSAACGDSLILRSEGDTDAMVWTSSARACRTVPAELIEAVRNGISSDAGEATQRELGDSLARDLRVYRACEAYGNRAIDAADYRSVVLSNGGAP